ncbi:unnamed protein product [Owenia fusiformis]|uniref:Uncharacterized protein n=1 Tax=Owenia fusiformis TaxID=6347 RepID=A0A8J1TSB9_OWEFU|nr:unnamed protein product [Owenia fusiformis]
MVAFVTILLLAVGCVVPFSQGLTSRFTSASKCWPHIEGCNPDELCCKDSKTDVKYCLPRGEASTCLQASIGTKIRPVGTMICRSKGKQCPGSDLCCMDTINNEFFCASSYHYKNPDLICMSARIYS